MEYDEHVAAVAAAAAAFGAALDRGDPDAPVPTCPDWRLADLTRHAGEFCGLWAHVLCEGTGRPKPPFIDFDDIGGDLGAWWAAASGMVVDELRATPPTTTTWSWMPAGNNAAFVARRCAHELAIHRVDAELATGSDVTPLDPALAADGIEEIVVMVHAWGPPSGAGGGETLHLHGTDRPDAGDEWLLTLGPDGLGVDRAHAKGDLALRGAVTDLELVLYQRPPSGQVDRLGDESVLDAWHRAFTFA